MVFLAGPASVVFQVSQVGPASAAILVVVLAATAAAVSVASLAFQAFLGLAVTAAVVFLDTLAAVLAVFRVFPVGPASVGSQVFLDGPVFPVTLVAAYLAGLELAVFLAGLVGLEFPAIPVAASVATLGLVLQVSQEFRAGLELAATVVVAYLVILAAEFLAGRAFLDFLGFLAGLASAVTAVAALAATAALALPASPAAQASRASAGILEAGFLVFLVDLAGLASLVTLALLLRFTTLPLHLPGFLPCQLALQLNDRDRLRQGIRDTTLPWRRLSITVDQHGSKRYRPMQWT